MRTLVEVVDIETLANLFLACTKDIKTKEKRSFLICRHVDQFEEFMDHLAKTRVHIGYNNIAFDGQVIQWIWDNQEKLRFMTGEEKAIAIYKFAQECIDLSNRGEFPRYSERKLLIKQIDLYKIWHFNNRAKATSLKWIQFAIDWPDVREMPIHHTTWIVEEQIADIISYCFNDVDSTFAFYLITRGETVLSEYKGKDKLAFRNSIKKKTGLECLNWNDVKIGEEMNFQKYHMTTGLLKDEIKSQVIRRTSVDLKDCVPDYIHFKTTQLSDLLERIRATTIRIPVIKDSFEHNIVIGQTQHNIKLGGLHSCESPRIIRPGPNQILRDADVGSQYPSALAKRHIKPEHLDDCWSQNITFSIIERIELKPLSKKDKDVAAFCEAIKLSLNGGAYGKLGEETNWQHDYKAMYQVTIGCQMEILMLIEELELAGISVISSNTDGIVSLFDKNLEDDYNRICTEWEEKVLVADKQYGKLEFADYSVLVQTSVNDYIAVKPNGEVKKKGDFMTDFEIHKNKSRRIIPLALEAYFVRGESVKSFVRNHTNIFDFCIGVKAKGDWFYEARSLKGGEYKTEKLQKLVRYFVSNDGVKLMKRNPDGRDSQCESGRFLQTVFNRYEESAMDKYNINYEYYIQGVFDIIHKIDSSITVNYTQLGLF